MQQDRAPLWEGLKLYKNEKITRFHMPGHKAGRAFAPEWNEALSGSFDVTEVPGTDDLHHPKGIIQEAETLAAQAFGADNSFFLVNGTSCGIMAMLLAAVSPGERIIVPRNVHRSILNGLIFSGAVPVYIRPETEEKWGMALGVTPESVQQALLDYPDSKAVLLVSPTYYGVVPELKRIIDLVHSAGKPVLVDEAHGAHLAFHPELPSSSLFYGADLSAQGAHKTLSSLTQSAFLHQKGDLVDLERVKQALRLVQSTSPSYLLLASLDLARRQMAESGRDMLDITLSQVRKTRMAIKSLSGFRALGPEESGRPGFKALDETKLTVLTAKTGLTGWEIDKILRRSYGIQAELAAYQHLLFMFTIGTTDKDAALLQQALQELDCQGNLRCSTVDFSFIPEQVLSPREAYFQNRESLPLAEALGRIAGESVVPYPPGIPVLVPGERIDSLVLECLQELKENKQNIQGMADHTMETIVVLK
ncbi:MAG: aminotransferase class I/II-fold pyridoxal phosphate-dependent enzyme [bacterium]